LCSHHNDYRLAWGINEELSIQLKKAEEDYVITNKKGQKVSQHSLYEFRDEENLIEYYLIKNKSLGKYLIPEKPAIDYFLFLFENHIWEPEDLLAKLKTISSVLGGFVFDPEEFESTELLVFN
ncbi:MAG: IPExxxVDY family protein, partial [Flavobacteriia bacterium]